MAQTHVSRQQLYKHCTLYMYSGASLIRIIHLSGHLFGTNPHSSTEIDSLIRKFSYPDSQSANRGVRISEVPLCLKNKILHKSQFLCSLKKFLREYSRRFV